VANVAASSFVLASVTFCWQLKCLRFAQVFTDNGHEQVAEVGSNYSPLANTNNDALFALTAPATTGSLLPV
jgi:hypothetical protein